MTVRAEYLVDVARTWLGTPFVHQGRNRHGVDCIGFVCSVFGELGEDSLLQRLPRDYARQPKAELLEGLREVAVEETTPQPGLIALLSWPGAKHPSHVAIVTGRTLIHCYQHAGKVVEHGFRGNWLSRTHSLWRANCLDV